jgi:hypothetical protein
MKNLMIVLIGILLSTATPLHSQGVQCLPRDGEGLKNKSNTAVFWINPIGLQPSVFFNKAGIDPQRNRKWWRNAQVSPTKTPLITEEMLPVAFVQRNSSPKFDWQKSLSKSSLVLSKFGTTIPKVGPLWKNKEVNNN